MTPTEIEQQFKSWWQFFDYCFNHNPASTMCETFWSRSVAAFIGLGVLLVGFGVWRAVDYYRKLQQARIAQWERESVDEAGIREAAWKGDMPAIESTATDEDLLAQIRAGIDQRKQEVSRPLDGQATHTP